MSKGIDRTNTTSQQTAFIDFSRREFLRMIGLVRFGTVGFGVTKHWSVTAQTLQSPTDHQAIANQIKILVDNFGQRKSAVGLAVGVVYPGKTKKTASGLKLTPTAASSIATTQTCFWGETQQGNGQLPDAQTVFGIGWQRVEQVCAFARIGRDAVQLSPNLCPRTMSSLFPRRMYENTIGIVLALGGCL